MRYDLLIQCLLFHLTSSSDELIELCESRFTFLPNSSLFCHSCEGMRLYYIHFKSYERQTPIVDLLFPLAFVQSPQSAPENIVPPSKKPKGGQKHKQPRGEESIGKCIYIPSPLLLFKRGEHLLMIRCMEIETK